METKVVTYSAKTIKNLQKFTSKDKTRDYLMNVVYNNKFKNISATDGKICAKIDNVDFETEGELFNVTIVNETSILLTETNLGYPNVNRIFPDDFNGYDEHEISLKGNKKHISTEISIVLHELKHVINFNYLLQFPKEDFTCYESKDHNQVTFKSKDTNLSIVVMPIVKR